MIHLLAPQFVPALLLLPGAVVLLYLIRRRRARLRHPTLMFLRHAETVLDSSRLSPRLAASLLLALDLLIAAALALALCRPALPGTATGARTTLLLLDTSASLTATRDGTPAFAALRERARRHIREMPRGDEAAIFTLDRRLGAVCPATADRTRLLAALETLAPREVPLIPDDAADARRMLGRGTDEAAVLFLTDGALPAGVDPLSFADRVEAFPAPFDNIGIVALSAARAADRADGFDLTLTLASTAAAPREVDLELYGDGELVDMRRVEAAPGLSIHRFAAVRMKPGLLTALLPEPDHFAADDRAYALAAADDLHFHHLEAEDPVLSALFAALPDFAAAPGVTGAVHIATGDLPVPTVALAALRFQGADGADRPFRTLLAPTVDPDHPVTAGLDPTEFLIGEGRYLDPPEGAAVLLGTPEACVAWLGVEAGRMTARFGFLPERTNATRRAFLPLLVSRAARHVASYHARVETSGRTGDPFVLRGAAKETRILAPDGTAHAFPHGGEIFFIATDRTGPYRVSDPGGGLIVPLNLFSAEESLTAPRALDAGTLPERRAVRATMRELTGWALLAALALLLAEWAVLRRSL